MKLFNKPCKKGEAEKRRKEEVKKRYIYILERDSIRRGTLQDQVWWEGHFSW